MQGLGSERCPLRVARPVEHECRCLLLARGANRNDIESAITQVERRPPRETSDLRCVQHLDLAPDRTGLRHGYWTSHVTMMRRPSDNSARSSSASRSTSAAPAIARRPRTVVCSLTLINSVTSSPRVS